MADLDLASWGEVTKAASASGPKIGVFWGGDAEFSFPDQSFIDIDGQREAGQNLVDGYIRQGLSAILAGVYKLSPPFIAERIIAA
jgi:hypothetical protein